MTRAIILGKPTVRGFIFPPGVTYDLGVFVQGKYITLDQSIFFDTTFPTEFPIGGAYEPYGIDALIYPGVLIQAISNVGEHQYILYTPTQLPGSFSGVYATETTHRFGYGLPRIRYDRTDHHIAWTMAVGSVLTASESVDALFGYDGMPTSLDHWEHVTGDYLPWYIVNTTDGGATWADALLEYAGQLEGFLRAGSQLDPLILPPQPGRVSRTARPWYDFQVVAPAHDGVNCYSFATFRRYDESSEISGPDPARYFKVNHTWIIKTDAAGTHSGNLVFIAGTNYGAAGTSRIVLAETDPTDSNIVYCMSNDGGFYVLDWFAGTLTSKTAELGIAGVYGEDFGDTAPGDYGLMIADDGSIIVPNLFFGSFIIYRSTDGGDTWTANDLTAQLGSAGIEFLELFTEVQSDGTLLIQASKQFFWSTDNGLNWSVSSVLPIISPDFVAAAMASYVKI